VWEWCWDLNVTSRRFRGGRWDSYADGCAVSSRYINPPGYSFPNGGLRLARSSGT